MFQCSGVFTDMFHKCYMALQPRLIWCLSLALSLLSVFNLPKPCESAPCLGDRNDLNKQGSFIQHVFTKCLPCVFIPWALFFLFLLAGSSSPRGLRLSLILIPLTTLECWTVLPSEKAKGSPWGAPEWGEEEEGVWQIERDFDAFFLGPCFVQRKPEGYLDFGIFLIFWLTGYSRYFNLMLILCGCV